MDTNTTINHRWLIAKIIDRYIATATVPPPILRHVFALLTQGICREEFLRNLGGASNDSLRGFGSTSQLYRYTAWSKCSSAGVSVAYSDHVSSVRLYLDGHWHIVIKNAEPIIPHTVTEVPLLNDVCFDHDALAIRADGSFYACRQEDIPSNPIDRYYLLPDESVPAQNAIAAAVLDGWQ